MNIDHATFNTITDAEQVTEELLEQAFEIVEGYYLDQPLNSFDFLDRLETWTGVDFGSKIDTPAIELVLKKARAHRRRIKQGEEQ